MKPAKLLNCLPTYLPLYLTTVEKNHSAFFLYISRTLCVYIRIPPLYIPYINSWRSKCIFFSCFNPNPTTLTSIIIWMLNDDETCMRMRERITWRRKQSESKKKKNTFTVSARNTFFLFISAFLLINSQKKKCLCVGV